MALGMGSFLTDVLALVHDVSNRAGIVAAGNTVALPVVDPMYGAIVDAVNYNTSIVLWVAVLDTGGRYGRRSLA
jgi:hypothetical protein